MTDKWPEATRIPPRKFALAVACFGGGAVTFTHSAFSGNQDWQPDALIAIGFWLLLALLLIYHFYWYKLPRSSQLIAVGTSGVGMGVVLVAATVLLQVPNIVGAVLVIPVGAVLIALGLWTRYRDRDTIPRNGRPSGNAHPPGQGNS